MPAPETDDAAWNRVQDVIGPLDGGADADVLYSLGGERAAVTPTPSGDRAALRVAAGSTVSFGTYFNAFPAAVWRAATTATRVRLELRLDGAAVVRLLRSDAAGERVGERGGASEDGVVVLETPLGEPAGGFVWFEVEAAGAPVTVLGGSWSVDAPPLRGSAAVLGMPTMDRGPFVAANLRRLASAPELLAAVLRIAVVDQGNAPVAEDPEVRAAAERLGGVLRLIRQPNLGGAGGFSRVMLEAVEEPGADVVVLLDDDIEIEPASLLRAMAFGRATRIPTIVGGQQLDLGSPGTVQAAAERVLPGVFWWAPADERTSTNDHAEHPLEAAPWVHARHDADYNGWWMCQLPVEAVRRLGFALPMFLKWDDAEYGLRAAAAGVPTVSLPGAAVWHVAFRTKDDSVEWQAFFHARNRVVAAVLHGGSAAAVVGHSLALDVKQLLAMQYPASRLRHAGLRAALAGPRALERRDDLARARRIATAAPRPPPPGSRRGRRRPAGARRRRGPDRDPARPLDRPRRWPASWPPPLPRTRCACRGRPGGCSPGTAGSTRPPRTARPCSCSSRDRRALLTGLAGALVLHARLLLGWRRLAARYGTAAPALASPAAWRRRFTA